ncbi:MAG: hypothetical protein KKB62_02915 [Nanoarchaeota archaeon]|nr:hypothetical protein [Nanoarchaeota archaeon]
MSIFNYDMISSFSPMLYLLLGGVFGDTFMILVGFLYSQGEISFLEPILFTFAGLIIADCLFYFIGRSPYFDRLKRTKKVGNILRKANSTIDFLTLNSLLVALFYSKFIAGAKFIINFYLGEKKVPFKKYFIWNFFMAVFWTIISWGIGYVSGEGFNWIWRYFDSLALASFFILLIAGIVFNYSKKLKSHFRKKYHNYSF